LAIVDLIKFFDRSQFNGKADNLLDALRELIGWRKVGDSWDEKSRYESVHDTLPIGWIYSGLIANVLMMCVYEEFTKATGKIIDTYPFVKDVKFLSFADDIVFLISFKQKNESEENYKDICKDLIDIINDSFSNLGFTGVKCHGVEAKKSTFFKITK